MENTSSSLQMIWSFQFGLGPSNVSPPIFVLCHWTTSFLLFSFLPPVSSCTGLVDQDISHQKLAHIINYLLKVLFERLKKQTASQLVISFPQKGHKQVQYLTNKHLSMLLWVHYTAQLCFTLLQGHCKQINSRSWFILGVNWDGTERWNWRNNMDQIENTC